MKRRSLLLIFLTTCVLGVGATPAGADDVPLIADIDIEALLEQELETLNVGDFYLLEHLVDINTKVKDRQTRMGAVRDEADRIFARFLTIENQIALDREHSETVLGKAFERVVRTYTISDEAQQEEVHQDDFERPDPEPGKDVLLGAATRGDLSNVDTIVPAATLQPSAAATPQRSEVGSTVPPPFEGPSVLVMLLEELERSQSTQAELRETLRDELETLSTQLEDMEESETELDGAIRGLRAELVAIEAREIEWDPEEITPETIIN